MTVRPHPTHAPSLWPGVCPGGQVVRLVSDRLNQIILEHLLAPTLTVEGVEAAADTDYDRALGWLEEHPDDVVFAYVYDGDSGACDRVTFLAGSNVRADRQGKPRVRIVDTNLNQCAPAPAEPATRIIERVGD